MKHCEDVQEIQINEAQKLINAPRIKTVQRIIIVDTEIWSGSLLLPGIHVNT